MRILLEIVADLSEEHAESMLGDLANHVRRYNPRIFQTVEASLDRLEDPWLTVDLLSDSSEEVFATLELTEEEHSQILRVGIMQLINHAIKVDPRGDAMSVPDHAHVHRSEEFWAPFHAKCDELGSTSDAIEFFLARIEELEAQVEEMEGALRILAAKTKEVTP